MEQVTIRIPQSEYRPILAHLLQPDGCENAAFVFCNCEPHSNGVQFSYVDWLAVEPDDCVARSAYYLQLADETRARVIKQAHDLQTSLVEFHSHRSAFPAAFSTSDFGGFDEFVPHVWWRLKGRPYAAVVVAESSFDGIAWIKDARSAQAMTAIDTHVELLRPTGLSLRYQTHE